MKNYTISIYLDTRRPKKSGKYPLKLRVYTKTPRKQKLYPIDYEFTEKEFNAIWETLKPRNGEKEIRKKIQSIETQAEKIAESLPVFTFESFENIFFKGTGTDTINHFFDEIISTLERRNQFSSAKNYKQALKHLLRYHSKPYLLFAEITPKFLEDFEIAMLNDNMKQNTIAIYLRTLRAVFNKGISEKAVHPDQYPFGKGKFEITTEATMKKALSKTQLRTLFEFQPEKPDQVKAKDFFFFSYFCNGMNFKDICSLKFKNLQPDPFQPDRIVFVRAKTGKSKQTPESTTVYVDEEILSVINKYGNPERNPENFVFDIFSLEDTPEQKHRKVKAFTLFANNQLEKISKSLNLPKVTTYFARHSYATNAINNGASMEFVSKALSHTNMKTTQNYFAGFSDEVARETSTKARKF